MGTRRVFVHIVLGCLGVGLVLIGCSSPSAKMAQWKQQKRVEDSIAKVDQERSLAYYQATLDSLLPQANALLDSRFRYEKNVQYEDHGHYVHRRLRTSNNTERNYVQAYITDDFRLMVKVYTTGRQSLSPVKVTLAAGEQYIVKEGSSHSFESGEWHDLLTLTDSTAADALHFIDLYRSEPIRVRLQGKGGTRTFALSESDKQALLDTYQLGCLMQDIHQLEKQIKRTNLEIQKYEHRIHHSA